MQRLLQRLEDKGYVMRDTSQPVLLFSAAISLQEYAASQWESLAAKLTGGSLAPLITQCIERKKISPEEIEQIRAMLEDRQDEGRRS